MIVVDTTNVFAQFGGQTLLATQHLSADRQSITLNYSSPLPASERIRVIVNGDGLRGAVGDAVDVDGDGVPGGVATIDFDTLSLSRISNTNVWGYVYDAYTPTKPLVGVIIRVDGFPEANARVPISCRDVWLAHQHVRNSQRQRKNVHGELQSD